MARPGVGLLDIRSRSKSRRYKQVKSTSETPLLDFALDERRVQRFHARVDRSGGPNACWPWTGATNRGNYGQIHWKGRTLQAHRVALVLADNIPSDASLLALHGCNNPVCVNPQHLRWGTHKENAEDKVKAGRVYVPDLRGEAHPNPRLTEPDVLEIVERLGRGEKQSDIARDFGVIHQTISDIKRGKKWAALTGRG